MFPKILEIVILSLILVETLLHQFLSDFYKERTLPYMMGFASFTTFLVVISSINFFHYFKPVIAIILTFLVLFPIHIHYLLAPALFIMKYLHILNKKIDIWIPGNFALFCLGFYCIIFWLILLLTIISFFFIVPTLGIQINIYWVLLFIVSIITNIYGSKILKNLSYKMYEDLKK